MKVYHQPRVYCSLHNCFCYTQHTIISAVSFLKFKTFTAVATLIKGGVIKGGVPSVQRLLQVTQLYCYTQHTFISAVSFLKFDTLTGVIILIRGGVPTVQNLLQFGQLYHCIQHNCISAGLFLNLKLYCSCHLNQRRCTISSESTTVYTILLLYTTILHFSCVILEI